MSLPPMPSLVKKENNTMRSASVELLCIWLNYHCLPLTCHMLALLSHRSRRHQPVSSFLDGHPPSLVELPLLIPKASVFSSPFNPSQARDTSLNAFASLTPYFAPLRGGFIIKLRSLKLLSPSFKWAPSKALHLLLYSFVICIRLVGK